MSKKTTSLLFALSLGALLHSASSYGETTTTVEQTATQSQTATHVVPRHVVRRARRAATTTTTLNTTATTVQTSPRKVLDADTLKKISNTLCTTGFKAYISSDRKNVCQSTASSPDIAYTCVWSKHGAAAYSPMDQGPCSLDFVEHRGSVVITKENYKSSPPLAYGVEAQCCFRAARDPGVSTSTSTTY